MTNENKVDLVQPTIAEQEAFWKDVKDVCEKHSFILQTGFSVQKVVKVVVVDKEDLNDTPKVA